MCSHTSYSNQPQQNILSSTKHEVCGTTPSATFYRRGVHGEHSHNPAIVTPMLLFLNPNALPVTHRFHKSFHCHHRHHHHTPSQLRQTPQCRRAEWSDVINRLPANELYKHGLAVPRHLWSTRMRRTGVYRSVEYKIEELYLDGQELISTLDVPKHRRGDVLVTIRPLNRLHSRFEKHWPVRVSLSEAELWSYKKDLLRCAFVTVALSIGFLVLGYVGPSVMGIYSIPSTSMEPCLRVGDALLVEKVSLRRLPARDGEIVLFRPPERLGGLLSRDVRVRRNSLFVKRVVAVQGDVIEVCGEGVRVNGVIVDDKVPGSPNVPARVVDDGFVFVVGDNPGSSFDSRYWGLLPVECIVGRPVARIFPLDRLDFNV